MDCDAHSTASQSPIESASASSTPTTNHLGSTITKKIEKRSRLVSEHFTKIEEGDLVDRRVSCNYCQKNYTFDTKRNGTSTLRHHLNSCKSYPNNLEDPNQKIISFKGRKDDECGLLVKAFSKEACRVACVRMIIKDELPFTFVEGEGFREFCAEACPKFDPPSRTTIARDMYQLYLEEKKKLRSFFINNNIMVSLTMDTWTSIQNIDYMVLTAHFVDDDWKLQKRILNFCQIANHKGDTIGKLIESCLIEWHIEKVFTITMDNAKANDTVVNYLKRRLKNWKNGIVLDGEFLHMRCCSHIINLIVTDELNEQNNSIDLIRKAVKYVRSSPSRLLKFKTYVEKEKIECKRLLVLDVSTRWNSTYLMLETACKFEKAFDRMEEEDEQYINYFGGVTPQFLDWEKARLFVQFLKTFYDVTRTFSASLNVNSNLFFIEFTKIEELLLELALDDDTKDMALSMKMKLDRYWGSVDKINKLLFVAHVLDPRYKFGLIEHVTNNLYPQEIRDAILKGVKDTLNRLFEFYVNSTSPPPSTQSNVDLQPTNVAYSSSDHGVERKKGIMWMYKRLKMSSGSRTKNEVERYLLEPDEDLDNPHFNVLDWWKLNSTKYRILSLIARDVFAIPLSTVATESAFSTEGRILDSYRSSLTPKMVEALICSQNWIRSIPLPLGIRVYDECFELCQEIEKDTSEACTILEWDTNVDT